MAQEYQHEMMIDKVYPSGAEEWRCPICGRRLMLQWNPEYRRIIMEIGEENIIHTGRKGQRNEKPVETVTQPRETIDRLAPWREWLESHKLDTWMID